MTVKTRPPRAVGILGVGNLLLGDEGFGVHCIKRLAGKYRFPDQVTLLDGGTAGIMLAPFIEDQDILYVIDVIALEGDPGSIHCFTGEELWRSPVTARMSPHQVGLVEILELCRLRDRLPDYLEMITVIPADLSMGIGLSPMLASSLERVETHLLAALAGQGIRLQKRRCGDAPGAAVGHA